MAKKYFNGNWHVYLNYSIETVSQDRIANTSTVRVNLAVGNDPGGYDIQFDPTYGAYIGVQLAGRTKYIEFGDLFIRGSEKSLGYVEFVVPHDEDGQATRTISMWSGSTEGVNYDGWYVGRLSLTTTETFKRIPRMSTIKSVEGKRALGEELTINLDRKVDTFTHQVWYKVWGSDWIELGKGLGTTIKFTPKPEEAKRNINVVSSTFDLCVRTYEDDKQIGIDEYSMGWYIGLPANTQPKLQTVELTDTAKATKDIVGKNMFVQTFSEMVCKFVGFEGTYGSTIKSYYAEVVGQKNTITKDNATFSIFKNYGDFQVQAFVTDSRGLKSNVVTVPIKVIQYFPPALNFEAFRSGGDLQTITVRRNVKIAPIMVEGEQKNTLSLKFKVKPANNGYFTDNAGAGITSKVVHTLTNSNADLSGKFRADTSWIVEGVISDAYTSFTFTAPIVGPEQVVVCKTPNGLAINKIWERGTLDVGGDIYSRGELVQVGKLTQPNGKSIKLTGSANDAMKTGLYYAYNLSDLPSELNTYQKYGYLEVNTHPDDNNFAVQIYIPHNTDVMYMRRKMPNGWQPWVKYNPGGVSTEWKTATLQSGWDHDTDYGSVQFSKTSDGLVCIKGSAKGGNVKYNTIVFTLPKEYRPKVETFITGLNYNYGVGVVGINKDGEVRIKSNFDSRWINLDSVIFRV